MKSPHLPRRPTALVPGLIATLLFTLVANADESPEWPGFRGLGNSLSSADNLPLTWSPTNNIAWSVELPGVGQSSPVVFRETVYVTSVEGANKETLIVSARALGTGEVRWEKRFDAAATQEDSDYVSKAAPTPVLDARGVYALFESGDFIALDHAGGVRWRRDLAGDYGPFEGNHGQGSSPVLTPHGVVVLVDHKGESFVATLDRDTGETKWKTARESSSAWSTPTLLKRGDTREIVVSASGSIAGYAAVDGKELWRVDGLDGNNVPSPTLVDNLMVVASRKKGFGQTYRFDPEHPGEAPVKAWTPEEASSAFGSPLVFKGRVYFVNDAGVAFCYDQSTGELLWSERVADAGWASPLGNHDRVYFFGKNGETTVVAAGDTFDVLQTNVLDVVTGDRVYGYAVADQSFIMRTASRLIRVKNGSVVR